MGGRSEKAPLVHKSSSEGPEVLLPTLPTLPYTPGHPYTSMLNETMLDETNPCVVFACEPGSNDILMYMEWSRC